MLAFDLTQGDIILLLAVVFLVVGPSQIGRVGNAVGRLVKGPPKEDP
jgi:Sec-independent protein translocase protein TatA